jgi:hypothetical protein
MICGIATVIDSRNSATNSTSTMFRSENLDILPRSESLDNVSAAAIRTFNSVSQRKSMISGMTCVIDS